MTSRPLQYLKQFCVSSVALGAWLLASSAVADSSELPKGHFLLPEEGNMVGQVYTVTATEEDTLLDIARAHNVGYEEIRMANPDTSLWVPGEGTAVTIPGQYILPDEARSGIVINVAELRLYYYPEVAEGETPRVETYPIGIGRDAYNTPLGITETTMRLENPAWYPPESIRREAAERGDPAPAVVPPGADNPLGEYAILLDIPGYLIHGTNQPDGIGMRASRGCIRMHPEDIESVFWRVPVGTQVNIIDSPIKVGWGEGKESYIQAFTATDEQAFGMETLLNVVGLIEQHDGGNTASINYEQVSEILERANGQIVPIS
ncbi:MULTISPECIES: L,D-transpeptidase family protein [Halomonadaceae]|uniref:L,D-transpeptidase family protein n=2 Tax=Vreelandella TaxID=3137766 RepID=A0A7Z0LQR2_9GAMM|nr:MULTISPECIES: L,D-transpeptidase family protein [Halomonas]AJY51681.1 ErfK/YbiS/YcfS/YnhG family protein [Halomonas sp. KO116]NYS76882.1 L,D-transpeptidase family protein [Halomonas glaciei]|tara:strand:- start:889 stop:1845 length:957 start_codon:yes stop_codon:yes gene_type:complete